MRFSNFAGLPAIADGDAAASPRGMSIKFMLPDGGDTDIVAHSYNGFPVEAPEGFPAFLRAVAAPDPAVFADFLATHPAAKTFAETPKPAPESFATEFYYGVNAFRFTNAGDISHYGRYRIEPVAGGAYLAAAEAAERPDDYLTDEMGERLDRGTVQFRLMVQLAEAGDDVTDGSVAWPEDRRLVDGRPRRIRPELATEDGHDRRAHL